MLLFFISSCVDVIEYQEKDQSNASWVNNDQSLKKCNERSNDYLTCTSDGKCHLYEGKCIDAEFSGENKYFKVSKQAGKTIYEIKEAVTKPTFIKKDGTLIENSSLETISYEDFSKLSQIALPESHPFAKQFIENPFVGKDFITSARPSMWGKLLVAQKTDKNTVVFSIDKDISKPDKKVIDEAKLTELFGDYKKNLLGQGGVGSVYKVTYEGKEYALKENAQEYSDLEKLQSTNAVAKVFGTFNVNNEPYMLMEVGQKSLADMNKSGEKLSEEQLKDAITNFKNLVVAQKKLGINNNDVKPNNLLLTKDNKIAMIDISSMYTRGYHDSTAKLLARSLLENKLEMSLVGGYIELERFFDFERGDQNYLKTVISPDLLIKWNKKVCIEILPEQDKCKDVKNFAEFFKLIPTEKLNEIALKINENYKDLSGTVDQDKSPAIGGGEYRTGLPMPLVQELDETVWQQYFDKKNNIISGFCRSIIANSQYTEEEEKNLPTKESFYKTFKDKYKKNCLEDGIEPNINNPKNTVTKYKLSKDFTSSTDEDFRQFIKDAYSYRIYIETIKKLIKDYSEKYTVKYLIDDIFNNELDKNDEVNKGLIELYNL